MAVKKERLHSSFQLKIKSQTVCTDTNMGHCVQLVLQIVDGKQGWPIACVAERMFSDLEVHRYIQLRLVLCR